MTDRRDFYHQAQVSHARARSNMLAAPFPIKAFENTKAFAELSQQIDLHKRPRREQLGDGFRGGLPRTDVPWKMPPVVHASFKSLFQGDHLGVEFALRNHEVLLQRGGGLVPDQRLQSNRPFPLTDCLEALVIDDYFAVSAGPVGRASSWAPRKRCGSSEGFQSSRCRGQVWS